MFGPQNGACLLHGRSSKVVAVIIMMLIHEL